MVEKLILLFAVLTAGMTTASASPIAVSMANVNLRAGSATSSPVVTVVPQGSRIVTHAYLDADGSGRINRGEVDGQPLVLRRTDRNADRVLTCSELEATRNRS